MEGRELAPRIVVDPTVRFGRPTVHGTRVPVDLILAKLAGGMTVQDVATDYAITIEDVLAVLAYAARVVAGEDVLVTG
ncbi:MAG: DUF433 domain-containing protein [Chloroflexaceae bacterium]|nr:DUF433 domain-containing protein [Chloroflexaceae bacterium]